ncbi:hypothetical protein T08_3575 [Trichinella sp. T8]|uniref:Uncharacterized protein n=1 Tax=Trichinella murrelli TaxID=144512 RepID=A0A0V0U8B5_9BILA|nr:hypothetical protein T05_15679 [Trichinella murrelli]KRZ88343.1 hypothetical protein T08_3575 [Trichinella sp. T8]
MVVQYGRIEMIKLKIRPFGVEEKVGFCEEKFSQEHEDWPNDEQVEEENENNYFYVEDEGAVFLFFKYSKFMEYLVVMMMMMGAALPSALPLSSGAFAGSFCLVGRLSEACAWLLKLE